jgi:pimeloyl-ACP methyl ester carboxylesterase
MISWFLRQTAQKRPVFLMALTASLLAASPPQAGNYNVVSESTSSVALPVGELLLTQTVIQDGPLPINRFTMHRLHRPNFPRAGSILLLPALGNNFNGYLNSEDGDLKKSFAAYFARLGYEVWGYSPRETGLNAGACSGPTDCSPALNWSLGTVIQDVTYIRSRIKSASPGRDPVIGGLSLGAITAIAVVNQYPNHYSGLLAWEGSPVTDDPAIQAHNQGFCEQFSGLVAAGVVVDDQSLPFVKLVAQLAQVAPNDPFPIPVPGFPPGLTNDQAFTLILTTPNPIAPSPRPGFITAVGDFTTAQLFHSDKARLAANIATFNDATATRTSRDLYCSLAGVETSYYSNLSKFKAPVMIIKAGLGFGSIMDELPAKLKSKSVTFSSMDAFGHVDHLGSASHLALLEIPILVWLNGVF